MGYAKPAIAAPANDDRPPAGRLRRLVRSNLVFCLGLAAAMLATRIIAFDAGVIFNLQFLPNHDMAGGIPFFATNVHAIRTTGEIAWWNPVAYSGHGYPQYFQSFLSPLAPTSGHIVLIAWMQAVRALAAVGITAPEYVQYLVMNFGLLPLLTFFSFAVFASLIFRRRADRSLGGDRLHAVRDRAVEFGVVLFPGIVHAFLPAGRVGRVTAATDVAASRGPNRGDSHSGRLD